MVDSIINCDKIDDAQVVVLGVGYDRTSSFRKGADKGPAAVIACLDSKVELFERVTKTEPARLYKIAYQELKNINALTPKKMVAAVEKNVRSIMQAEQFMVMLGGSHSISTGVFQALARVKKPQDITVVQVDAHLDMRDDDSDYNDKNPSRYAHSCVMRRAYDLGFQTVQVGIRDYSQAEYDFVSGKKLSVFEWGMGEEPSVKSVLKAIKTKAVYLTVDVDGLDAAITPSTGTPVPGGISWRYMQNFIIALFQHKNIIGADIVEVAPHPDDVITQYTAAQLCYNMIAYKFYHHGVVI